jgi:hypothetical protein
MVFSKQAQNDAPRTSGRTVLGTVPGVVRNVTCSGVWVAISRLIVGPNSTGVFRLTSNSTSALTFGPVREATCRPTCKVTPTVTSESISTAVCGAVRGVIR